MFWSPFGLQPTSNRRRRPASGNRALLQPLPPHLAPAAPPRHPLLGTPSRSQPPNPLPSRRTVDRRRIRSCVLSFFALWPLVSLTCSWRGFHPLLLPPSRDAPSTILLHFFIRFAFGRRLLFNIGLKMVGTNCRLSLGTDVKPVLCRIKSLKLFSGAGIKSFLNWRRKPPSLLILFRLICYEMFYYLSQFQLLLLLYIVCSTIIFWHIWLTFHKKKKLGKNTLGTIYHIFYLQLDGLFNYL